MLVRYHLLRPKRLPQQSPTAAEVPLFHYIIVCQCPSYTDLVGDPPEHRYCLIEQLETMEDQGNNDVVIGVGQAARSGT